MIVSLLARSLWFVKALSVRGMLFRKASSVWIDAASAFPFNMYLSVLVYSTHIILPRQSAYANFWIIHHKLGEIDLTVFAQVLSVFDFDYIYDERPRNSAGGIPFTRQGWIAVQKVMRGMWLAVEPRNMPLNSSQLHNLIICSAVINSRCCPKWGRFFRNTLPARTMLNDTIWLHDYLYWWNRSFIISVSKHV